MDIVAFRLDFPEFNSLTRYPSSQIQFWATLAEAQVRECVWKEMKPYGVMLYVAHELTLATQNQALAQNGGVPGSGSVGSGPINSKTVGNVTVSYDATQAAEKDAGWWNLTVYGKQFYRLMRIFGAGAIQL